MNLDFARVWFVFSLLVLSFVYGAAVGKWHWFPYSFLDQATDQARSVLTSDTTDSVHLTKEKVYEREGVSQIDPEDMYPGMTLVVSAWEKSGELRPGARLLDETGRILHSWQPRRRSLFSDPIGFVSNVKSTDFHGSYLFPNGDLLLVLSHIGVARIDACGNVVWRLEEGSAHHSISRAIDGTFWIPGTSSERRARTSKFPNGFPGIDKPVWIDKILNVSEEGEVIEKINVLETLYENELERYIVKSMRPYPGPVEVKNDPIHLNDVEPLSPSQADEYPLFEAGDLLVSLRHPSLVFVFDPESGKVKWHASESFIHQHDPDFLGNGWIGVFDNNTDLAGRGKMLGGSRIVALQPHTDSTAIKFPTEHSDSFYTSVRGKWQQLENGNMLLTESDPGRVVEVTPKGRTVWEWIHETHSESRVPFVTKATRYNLAPEDVDDWPCSSVDSGGATARSN